MQTYIYQQFAIHMLSDLAERRDHKGANLARGQRRQETFSGEKRRVSLWGDHIHYQDPVAFRGSDCSFRLAMAVSAVEKAYHLDHGKVHGANWWACVNAAQLILKSPCKRLRAVFLKGRRGPNPKAAKVDPQPARSVSPSAEQRAPRFAELEARIVAEPKRTPSGIPKLSVEVRKLARIVRSQVDQFRRKHQDYDQLFDMWLGAFRHEFYRDAEWYAAAELEYRRRVRRCERKVGAYHEMTASQTVNLARLLHEQRKSSEAAAIYRLAISRWKKSPVADDFRDMMLSWLGSELEACMAHRSPGPQFLPN